MELMRKTWCDVGHTDMSEMPYCFFSPDITKGAKNIMNFLDITKGPKNIMKFWDYEGHKINHELLGELK